MLSRFFDRNILNEVEENVRAERIVVVTDQEINELQSGVLVFVPKQLRTLCKRQGHRIVRNTFACCG